MGVTTTAAGDTAMLDGSTTFSAALVPPPKLRRRPALVAGAIAAICLGALISGWAWVATTNTNEVLVARHSIERGAVIDAEDVARVRIGTDPALQPLPGSEFPTVVGQRAAMDIAGGSLLTAEAISGDLVPSTGMSVVGVALSPDRAPGLALHTGDRVRIVVTPSEGDEQASGPPPFDEAEVVSVHRGEETGLTVIDLLVPHASATVLAARIASGDIALVLDSRER